METNKNLTSIEAAIKLSKTVISLKILLHRLRQNKMYMNSVPLITFHSAKDDLERAIVDVEYNINVTEKHIQGFIKPYLGKDEYNYPDKYSFTARELVEGFATLERILQKDSQGKIIRSVPMALLLSNHKDHSPILNLSAGQVISFEGHKDILMSMNSVITQRELDAFLKPNYSCTFNIEQLFPK